MTGSMAVVASLNLCRRLWVFIRHVVAMYWLVSGARGGGGYYMYYMIQNQMKNLSK